MAHPAADVLLDMTVVRRPGRTAVVGEDEGTL